MSRPLITRFILLVGVLLACVHCGAPAPDPGFPTLPPTSTIAAAPAPPPPSPSAPVIVPPQTPTYEPVDAPPPVEMISWGQVITAPPGSTIVILTDPGDVPRLEMAGDKSKFPLLHTDVRANVRGGVAEVEVTQTYQNPSDKPIEAVYIFPLPENSAVYRMRMAIGQRVIEADVKERKVAKKMYDDARREGHTAALLEQERPNIFTQSVANIEPGKQIEVKIQYVQDLTYDAGQYEFVFPMVVGPRYMAHTPDADRISPPYMGNGERSGADISVEVNVDPGPDVADVEVPTHEVSKKALKGALKVAITEKKSLPNRDFVMRWRVVGAKPRARLLLSEPSEKGDGYFSLLLHPPELPIENLVGRREIIFVVDISGSMSGMPLALCQMAMQQALAGLRPVDTFNIVTFAARTGKAFEKPRPANRESLRDGLAFINNMHAGGGTEMANAVHEVLQPKVESGRHRYVFFLTDGFVGGEREIVDEAHELVSVLEKKEQHARVFGVGIGSSPNRHLIDELSNAGKGVATYAGNREDPARAINKIYHYIDRAVLTEVKPDLAAIGAEDVVPFETPDLFASHPVVLHGRYKNAPTGPVVIRAKVGTESVEIPVDVRRAVGETMGTLGRLWARAKITSLEQRVGGEDVVAANKEITNLGLMFHLVTRNTSLIAIDSSQTVSDGNPEKIMQPVDGPEGVDLERAAEELEESQTRMDCPADFAACGAENLDMEVAHGARGCHCRMGAGTSPSGGMAAGVVFVLVYLGRRRAKKRTPKSHS